MRHEVFSGEAAVSPPDRNARRLKQAHKRMDRICVTLGLVLAVCAGTSALAEPRTIDDCEKIQAADAYNQCLASFGPAAHEHAHSADPEGSGGGSSGRANAAADPDVSRPRGSSHYRYQRHAARQHHADPWANMRHAGRHRIGFSIK